MAKYIKTSTLRKFYKKEKIAGTKNGIFLADFGDRFCPLVKTVTFTTSREYKALEIIAQVENIDMTNVEDFFLQASHFYEQFQRTNSKTLGKHKKYEFRKEHEIIGTVERTLLSGKVYTKDTPPSQFILSLSCLHPELIGYNKPQKFTPVHITIGESIEECLEAIALNPNKYTEIRS